MVPCSVGVDFNIRQSDKELGREQTGSETATAYATHMRHSHGGILNCPSQDSSQLQVLSGHVEGGRGSGCMDSGRETGRVEGGRGSGCMGSGRETSRVEGGRVTSPHTV